MLIGVSSVCRSCFFSIYLNFYLSSKSQFKCLFSGSPPNSPYPCLPMSLGHSLFKHHYFQTYNATIPHFLPFISFLLPFKQHFSTIMFSCNNIMVLLPQLCNSETLCNICILFTSPPNYYSSFNFCCSHYEITIFLSNKK